MNIKVRSSLFKRLPFVFALKLVAFILIKKLLGFRYFNLNFSQTGEDAIISFVFRNLNRPGYYVDVGSFKPIQFSNSFYFYLNGWSGISIDGNPELVKQQRRIRKKDTVIEALVSNQQKEVNFYISNKDTAISSIHIEQGFENRIVDEYDEVITKQTRKIEDILDEHLPAQQTIDFMSIDVEGEDFNALKSINLEKYRPVLILMEVHNYEDVKEELINYMSNFGYSFMSYTTVNAYFLDSRFSN